MFYRHSSGKRRLLLKRIMSICIALIMICGISVQGFASNTGAADGDAAGQPAPAVTYNFYVEGELYNTQTLKTGETLTEPAAPAKSGFNFEGWFTAAEGGDKFTDFTARTVTEDNSVNLYAQWSVIPTPEPVTLEAENTLSAEAGEGTEAVTETDPSAGTEPGEPTPSPTPGNEGGSSGENGAETGQEGTETPTPTPETGEPTPTPETGEPTPTPGTETSTPETDQNGTEGAEEPTPTPEGTVTPSATPSVTPGETVGDGTENSETQTPDENGTVTEETTGETDKTEEETEADKNAADSVQAQANGIETMASKGDYKVEVGKTIQLQGSRGSNHQWWVSNAEGEVSFEGRTNGNSVTIKGVRAGTGTVTVTHQWGWIWPESETFTIEVLDSSETGTYDLYCYTLMPGREEDSSSNPDEVWNGMGMGEISGVRAPSTYPVSEYINDGYGGNGVTITYPANYPPIVDEEGIEYYYATTPEQENMEGYYTIRWIRVVTASGANAGNNKVNPTHEENPPGSTKNNTFHLDGVITLNEKNFYTVHFHLKDAGEDDFAVVEPEVYSTRVEAGYEARKLKRPDKNDPNNYPLEKTVNGIKYEFDGWYTDESCTQKVDFETATINANTNYYARYVPVTEEITITKQVTGGFGDVSKNFSFTYSYTDVSGKKITGEPFELKHDDSITILIPSGAILHLEETNAAGYSTSATYGDKNITVEGESESATKTMEIPITAGNGIVVTNHKEARPDTGVNLPSAPYVAALIFVFAGTAGFLISRRRKDIF